MEIINVGEKELKVSEIKSNLLSVIAAQHTLNKMTCGEDYILTGVAENTGKEINFQAAYFGEVNELMECNPYEHWKQRIPEPDKDNALVELVDIAHFLASWGLSLFGEDELTNVVETLQLEEFASSSELIRNVMNVDISDAGGYIDAMAAFFRGVGVRLEEMTHGSQEGTANIFMSVFLETYVCLEYFYLDFSENYMEEDQPEFLKAYMSKNLLNQLRVNNGYGAGTYTKLWVSQEHSGGENVEDNVIVKYIIGHLVNIGVVEPEAIYDHLSHVYNNIVKMDTLTYPELIKDIDAYLTEVM